MFCSATKRSNHLAQRKRGVWLNRTNSDIGKGVFKQCGRPGVHYVTTRQHLRMTGHKKMLMKTVTKDDAASRDDKIVSSDVAHIVDTVTVLKQPFTETDFLDENYHMTCSVLCMYSSTRNGQLTNVLHL